MLTDDAIRTLRATETSRKLFDEKGLYRKRPVLAA
jgi:hypothetical protein